MTTASNGWTRRTLLARAGLAGLMTGLARWSPAEARSWESSAARQGQAPAVRPDPIAPARVAEFVRAAHTDLDRTRTLLTETPALLNSAWDWGGGDFETALGGAAHMGNRPIAELLIGQGARVDVFAAAMLGHVDTVRAILSMHPALVHARGPHGIPLLAHAKAGGTRAEGVVEFLLSQGVR